LPWKRTLQPSRSLRHLPHDFLCLLPITSRTSRYLLGHHSLIGTWRYSSCRRTCPLTTCRRTTVAVARADDLSHARPAYVEIGRQQKCRRLPALSKTSALLTDPSVLGCLYTPEVSPCINHDHPVWLDVYFAASHPAATMDDISVYGCSIVKHCLASHVGDRWPHKKVALASYRDRADAENPKQFKQRFNGEDLRVQKLRSSV
jgi:hypothetical protein